MLVVMTSRQGRETDRQTDISVSYTHLDVYKRQILSCYFKLFVFILDFNVLSAVSYTHLDVYKRQG